MIILYTIFLRFVASKGTFWVPLLGFCVLGLFVVSYSCTALKNPGLILRKDTMFDEMYLNRIKDDSRVYCKVCNIVKKDSSKIEHCYDCNLCVEGTLLIESMTTIVPG